MMAPLILHQEKQNILIVWRFATQQLVQEIESQAVAAQQQINVVRTQITAKQREMRLLELTSGEIGQVPKDTNVYEGVGKMCV